MKYTADAQLLINELEATHPIFSLYETPMNYEETKSEYIEFTNKAISNREFLLATQKYLAILGDGHISMSLAFFTGDTLYIDDISWIANNGKLYLLDNNKKPTNIEIVSIGRKPINNVTAQVDIYFAAENDAARQRNYTIFCRQQDICRKAGCHYTNDGIELTMSDGKTIICKFKSFHDGLRNELHFHPKYIVKHELINDVFYIDLKSFRKDKSIDDTAEEIKNAIDNGTKKFIIDVRDNGGGNSNIGAYLLSAMGMTVPRYGVYKRHSKLLRESTYRDYDGESGINEPDISTAVPNNNINLLVLTNANTFSSATMFGVWVQDGKLGKIIGQVSSNKPNHYGDMLGLVLSDSKIIVSIPYKKFSRPDIEANPDSLIPDIQVPFGDDILTVALKYMADLK